MRLSLGEGFRFFVGVEESPNFLSQEGRCTTGAFLEDGLSGRGDIASDECWRDVPGGLSPCHMAIFLRLCMRPKFIISGSPSRMREHERTTMAGEQRCHEKRLSWRGECRSPGLPALRIHYSSVVAQVLMA